MVRINGKDVAAEGKTLAEYIEEANYDNKRVVVEINYEIVPKDQYEAVVLKAGDLVEVISFVGGG